MASLAIRKTSWNGLSIRNKQILRFIGDVLQLGVPAEFKAGGGAVWFVFDDHRFKARVIAYLGCVLANLTEIPSGYTLPIDGAGDLNKTQMRSDIRTFCESPTRSDLLVWPVPGAETWQDILDAQNAPASIQMASGVPDAWTAVGS
jgi:hypothetical protein